MHTYKQLIYKHSNRTVLATSLAWGAPRYTRYLVPGIITQFEKVYVCFKVWLIWEKEIKYDWMHMFRAIFPDTGKAVCVCSILWTCHNISECNISVTKHLLRRYLVDQAPYCMSLVPPGSSFPGGVLHAYK